MWNGELFVLSGASRGIGAAIAEGLVARGARVLLSSRSQASCDALAARLGDAAEGMAADVQDPAAVERLFARAAALGGAHGVVACAGLASSALGAQVSDDALLAMWDLHFRGAMRMLRAGYPQLKTQRGSALLIASIWGLGASTATLAYGSAKAAMIHATKVLAVEWARDQIRVNAIAPGFIETEMTAVMDAKTTQQLIARVPMRRMGQPAEIAGPACFLLSGEASYVTGHTLVVDGGARAR